MAAGGALTACLRPAGCHGQAQTHPYPLCTPPPLPPVAAAYVLANAAGALAKPPSPLAESVLRSYALDAACLGFKTEEACADAEEDHGCVWEKTLRGTSGVCGVDNDWADSSVADLPAIVALVREAAPK